MHVELKERSGTVLAVLLAGSASASTGCVSSYQPAPSPKIAVFMDDGGLALARDGRSYSLGMFGGGAVKAVEGNPAATEHAETYRAYMITGWTAYWGGIGVGLLGAGVWRAGERDADIDRAHAGEAMVLVGVAAVLTGTGFLLSAQPHLWDAVNLYNDEVERRLRMSWWPRPPLPPYGLPPTIAPPGGVLPVPAPPPPAPTR